MILQHKAMSASNCGGVSWAEEKSSIILDIMTHLVISKKLDPLADDTIQMVVGSRTPTRGGVNRRFKI